MNEMSEDECNEERITNECVYKAWVREFAPDVYKMLQVNEGETMSKRLPCVRGWWGKPLIEGKTPNELLLCSYTVIKDGAHVWYECTHCHATKQYEWAGVLVGGEEE